MTNEALDQLENELAAAADVAYNALSNLQRELHVVRSTIENAENGLDTGQANFVPAAELVQEVVRLTSAYEAIWRVTQAIYEMSPEHRAFVQRMSDTGVPEGSSARSRLVWEPDEYTIRRPGAEES
jgi:hypothetical protein